MTWFFSFTKTLSTFMNGLFENLGMGEQAEPWVGDFTKLFNGLFISIMKTINNFDN